MQHRTANRDLRKSAGEISDDVQQPQDERNAVQRRTFTRWMNVFLHRRNPPVEVRDLFTDIQDGRILMALLEELSGCKLLYRFRPSSHRIFRLNNISKALIFLDDRHVKLLGIDASGIADGVPSVVLNLVWNIILHFQVKEVTGGLQRHLSSSLSSLSMSSYPSSDELSPRPNDAGSFSCSTLPSKGRKAARAPKYHGKTIKTLLQWVQRCTSKFGVDVRDFGKSWRSGLAFLAVIKSINPSLVDLRESMCREPRENIHLAFMIAEHSLNIPPLLEPEDVSLSSPDEQSIITYVSMFLGHCSDTTEGRTTHIEVPEIPNFGSLESVSFGETLAEDPEAQDLLKGLEKSSEQLLWRRWARKASGCSGATSLHMSRALSSDLSSSSGDILSSCCSQSISEQPGGSAATSTFSKSKSNCRSASKPPSPMNAGVVSQEIRWWMEKASVAQGYSTLRADQSHFSLSSEEGMYSLSTLDSDEEEAYSYILDLNKEVFQPYNQLKRQVPKDEEETAEEVIPIRQQTTEPEHLEVCETFYRSGCKHQGGPRAQNVESKVGIQSGVHGKFDQDTNESSSKTISKKEDVFDMEPEGESRERAEEERTIGGQGNDDGDYCEDERRKVMRGCDRTEALQDETKKTKLFEVASWKTEIETDGGVDKEKEEENLTTFEERRGRIKEEEDNVKEEEKESLNAALNAESVEVNEKVLIDEALPFVEEKMEDSALRMVDLTHKDDAKEEYREEVVNFMGASREKDEVGMLKLQGCELTAVSPDVHPPARWETSEPSRDAGSSLQSSAASCDITPLELEMLLALWILLYCYFILPQMNL